MKVLITKIKKLKIENCKVIETTGDNSRNTKMQWKIF